MVKARDIRGSGKPTAEPNARKHWTQEDFAHLGLGSSDLTNWARAVVVLSRFKKTDRFQLQFAKRGKRSGIGHLLYLKQGEDDVKWTIDPDFDPEDEAHNALCEEKAKRPEVHKLAAFVKEALDRAGEEGMNATEVRQAIAANYGVSSSSAGRWWNKELQGQCVWDSGRNVFVARK